MATQTFLSRFWHEVYPQSQTEKEARQGQSPDSQRQDDLEAQYPEGWRAANLVVFGSFCTITGGLGLMNGIGIYQSLIPSHQLQHVNESKRRWIFGLCNFMVFFCGIQIGPIFDMHSPWCLMVAGLVLHVATCVALGFRDAYWHFVLVIGLTAGTVTSVVFSCRLLPSGSTFERGATRRCDWVGHPGLIVVVLLPAGYIIVLPSNFRQQILAEQSILPDLRILCRPAVSLITVGVFFVKWDFFVGPEYVSSYTLASGIDRRLAYLMVVFLNAQLHSGEMTGRNRDGQVWALKHQDISE
ncbi:putative transporter MCH4 [Tolypocladium ophioglossoides CBS 100239]|uniref:Putative transporter MCH4 n=1 Tax=Tolypocladium ophioglossoides (strain CBS 100239) TaxID=1163406 RepID=A0A0L0NLK4_TOLOC|nr:putative transporter MCH4 [Tolypocladium ophioglossoides CBS 100239]